MVLLKYAGEVDFIRPRRPIGNERRVRDVEAFGEELWSADRGVAIWPSADNCSRWLSAARPNEQSFSFYFVSFFHFVDQGYVIPFIHSVGRSERRRVECSELTHLSDGCYVGVKARCLA